MTKIKKDCINLLLIAIKPKSSGYTLLESLMAIVVVGILITSVAPMLALTTASRVQARRVDLATQALRAYTDGVRGGVLPIPQRFIVSIATGTNFIELGPDYGFPPASSLLLGGNNYATINTSTVFPDSGTLVDTNGNGFSVDDPQDLVIQAIRTAAVCSPVCAANSADEIDNAKKQGYLLALRIYRADGFSGGVVPTETDQAGVFIGSAGSKSRPLVTSVVEIFPSDFDLERIKERADR
jgi:prepilin-type N-terminal cleavage/methylation domain-containing protein